MGKVFVFMVISLVLATLISMSIISPVQASIYTPNFIGATFRGDDRFYGYYDVVAYEAGSKAIVAIPVYSDYYVEYPYYEYRPVNVSAVKIGFGWGINYTADLPDIVVIEPFREHIFIMNFTVPSTTVASNLVLHSYTIYVEHVNSTTGPKKIVDTWTYDGYNFAVYSEDQADAQELYQELRDLRYMYGTYPLFLSSEARTLWIEAQIELSAGSTDYGRGDFTGAKAHYQTAWNLYHQSIESEATIGSALEVSLTNLMNSTAQSYAMLADLKDPLTNFLNSSVETSRMHAQAFMILSVGICMGIILIGIGAVVYALAKRKMAVASEAQASSS